MPKLSLSLYNIKRYTMWLLVAFFVVMGAFTVKSLTEKLEERRNAYAIQTWTKLSISFNNLIHELQKERGMSSGFISSGGERFSANLVQQRLLTDLATEKLHQAILDLPAEATTLSKLSESTLDEVGQLAGLRSKISEQRLSRDVAVACYNDMITHMFDHLLTTMSVGQAGWIIRQQMAFIFFLQEKEMAGQERALISTILSVRDFGAARMGEFHRIKAVEQSSADKFLQLAEPEFRVKYQEIMSSPYVASAERIRRLVLAIGSSDVKVFDKLPDPTEWFAIATQKIDAMGELEIVLSESLINSAGLVASAAEQALLMYAFILTVSFALAVGLLLLIWRGKTLTEHQLNLSAEVFANSVEAIIVADADANIIDVNPAFTRITGYERDEVLGQNPRALKSGRHDKVFYQAMWDKLLHTGCWEGEIWNRRKNGSIYPCLLSISSVKKIGGEVTHFIAMSVDLSKFKEAEQLLEQLRTFDALTGLPNRDAWNSAIDQAVQTAKRTAGRFAILDIGLDRFKMINESLGHAVGDQVLVAAAERIKQLLRRHDIAARSSGNHFAILLQDMDSPQAVGQFCEQLLSAFAQPLPVGENGINQGISIGAVIYPNDGRDTRSLLQNVESALHASRDEGSMRYLFYSSEMNAAGAKLLALEQMMRQALERNEFFVVYQPQVDVQSGALLGVEALIRWSNPELGLVSPVQFIPIAESSGMIVPIGEWVLRTACRDAARWRDMFQSDIQVAVNLSARQFAQSDLLVTVKLALEESGLPKELLELELTEGSLMADPSGATIIMQGLRYTGIKLALDDFGTGYSSLAYLKNFPLDRLKLDRAFVIDLVTDSHDQAIAKAVISLGHVLDMDVLAEGVETNEQADLLRHFGCNVFQGYLFGKPMPAEQLEAEIRSGRLVPRPHIA